MSIPSRPTQCMYCDQKLDDYDRQNAHSHCHGCRVSNERQTLARISLMIALGEDLSMVHGWSLIRELAGRRYGHKQADKDLLERLLGFVQATHSISREAAFRMPLSELGKLLNSEPIDDGFVGLSYPRSVDKFTDLTKFWPLN